MALPPISASYPSPDDRTTAAASAPDVDAELMLRVKDGDPAAFAQLLERHRLPVVSFLYRMVQHQGVAEELGQEVFLRIYRARATYEPTARFTTWLFRIATHLALNWLRDHKGEKTQESLDEPVAEGMGRQVKDRTPTTEQVMVADSRLHQVRLAVRRLPDKQRAAVMMHKYREMEYSQIARALECSESAVKSLLFRAYETLRSHLAHLDGNRRG